jgi:hypothetical protein
VISTPTTCPLRWALIALNFVMNCPGVDAVGAEGGADRGGRGRLAAGGLELELVVISFLAMRVLP